MPLVDCCSIFAVALNIHILDATVPRLKIEDGKTRESAERSWRRHQCQLHDLTIAVGVM